LFSFLHAASHAIDRLLFFLFFFFFRLYDSLPISLSGFPFYFLTHLFAPTNLYRLGTTTTWSQSSLITLSSSCLLINKALLSQLKRHAHQQQQQQQPPISI